MASIQCKMHKGHKYWVIVESKRINGKPRSTVIEYLGTADSLLKRLLEKAGNSKTKSFSHGAVTALLSLAKKLDVVEIVNKYTHSQKDYRKEKPLRNGLTSGITLLLAAIGRICHPTSKRAWYSSWAKSTSCDHLLRISTSQLDSQHFWDLMDSIPEEVIEKIEMEILQKALILYPLKNETLFYDTTNFFTFIGSENGRCTLAQRGKNKQKRTDLRQVGMALVVTQENYIPLFHHTYKGNIHDCKVFDKILKSIKERMEKLNLDIGQHTIVFDRGCNSKGNLKKVERLNLHYVGALTPAHHKDLLSSAEGHFTKVQVGENELEVYRDTRNIWGKKRTVLVFVSKKLKEGQLQGIYQSLEKKKKSLSKIQRALSNPKAKKRSESSIKNLIEKVLKGQFMKGLIDYDLTEIKEGHWSLTYNTNKKKLSDLEDQLGFRIVMTNRHEWETEKIIQAYYGQATVENAFKNLKNPYHLAVTPEFHWTDQKIKIHYFTCVLGYLLASLIWHEARKSGFKGSLDNLLDDLNDIRLSRRITFSGIQGKPKVSYELEEMSDQQQDLIEALNLSKTHLKPLKLEGVGEYI